MRWDTCADINATVERLQLREMGRQEKMGHEGPPEGGEEAGREQVDLPESSACTSEDSEGIKLSNPGDVREMFSSHTHTHTHYRR